MNAMLNMPDPVVGDCKTLRAMIKAEMEALMSGTASVQHALALGCLARQYLQTIDIQVKFLEAQRSVIEIDGPA